MSSNNNIDNITPDGPEMRSVRLQSSLEPAPMPMARSFSSKEPQVVRPSPRVNKIELSAPSKSWTTKGVPALPEGYPLERNHVYVGNASADQVARRIADVLRMESVAVHCEESVARCETSDHVTFNIRLFSSGNKIVVEIQRRSGCCFLFHQATRNVLRAALGQESLLSTTPTVPPYVMSELEEQDATDEALGMALSMLQSYRLDAHLLAMESLASLTKSNSSAAKTLVNGPLMEILLSIIESGDDHLHQDNHEKEHLVKMHRYALVVLANCLSAMPPNEIPMVSDSFLVTLIGELQAAHSRPHDACEAARSLKALVRSNDVRLRVISMGAPDALEGAYQSGKFQHRQLEKESRSLQMEMGN